MIARLLCKLTLTYICICEILYMYSNWKLKKQQKTDIRSPLYKHKAIELTMSFSGARPRQN